jgi:hypothetical protein
MRAGERARHKVRPSVKAAAWGAGLVMFLQAPAGHAQLRSEAERVAEVWRESGATVSLLTPRFLSGERTEILLPEGSRTACRTYVFLGARGLSFRVALVGAEENGSPERHASEAGAVETSECGD